jgi:predicted thioesterase
VGFEVVATAELLEVEGRRLIFRVEVRDAPPGGNPEEGELVGEGRHQRFIVDVARFGEGVAAKAEKVR